MRTLIHLLITTVTLIWSTNTVCQGQQAYVSSPDGVKIFYEVLGEGDPALVFVHGWSCDRNYWVGQLLPFSAKLKVVALDLAGHGESGSERHQYTMSAFGGDVEAVVNKLGLEKVILVGHSMGGDVIAEAARRLKGKVVGLIMVDTYKQLRTPRTPEQVEKFITPFRENFVVQTRSLVREMFLPGSDKSLVERIALDMSAAPTDVALSALEYAFSYSREMPTALRELKLDVIFINPDDSPTDVESLKQYGGEVIIMPGVGHFLMIEDVKRFNQLLTTAIEMLIK